jgi:hypothetical protein
MKHDAVERLAISVAKRLRDALVHPAKANEHANGYGTVCMTGHPVVESLWMQCVPSHPGSTLLEVQRDAVSMPSIGGVPRLPVVLYREEATTIKVLTQLWVLDELRWHSQCEVGEAPRSSLDRLLSRFNHGDITVVIHFADFMYILKRALR